MVTEDYVSFETAKLLKEKGFNCKKESITAMYREDGEFYSLSSSDPYYYDYNDFDEYDYIAPTLQMAMKWLRENHNLYVTSVPNGIGEYVFYPWVYKKFECGWNVLESSLNGFQNTEFSSPEEACEAAIKYCLENLI